VCKGELRSPAASEQPLSKEGGFELIFRDRYLMLIAALVVLINIVNTSGEFLHE
jgi:AAA family ATP:ADP antiporter